VLLVDDDLINQKVMTSLIRRRGLEGLSARNGRHCLELCATQTFDLVLMDIQMPELNGFQTAALIRELEARDPENPRRVPIIALTTVSEPGTRERCAAAGMDDYLPKPVNTRQLDEVLGRYVKLPPPPAANPPPVTGS